MKKKLELTVIICVADDIRIKDVLKTVDQNCEVVVVLNGATQQVKKIVKGFQDNGVFELKIIEIPERNLSKARNYGIENASYDKVVFYDSDCIIVSGALLKFNEMLEKYLLVDGKVFFKKDTFSSKIISYTREMGLPGYALCPAMGVNKKIKPLIGNHFFDNDIHWCEDSELNNRAKKKNVEVGVINDITCVHDNLTFRQDLKSAFRYGYGVRLEVAKKLHINRPTANWNLIIPIAKQNLISGVYYLLWNIIYCIGYYAKKSI